MLTLLALLASLYLSVVRCSPAGGAIDFLLVGDPTGVVQCEPHTLTWQGGTAPFAVTVQDPVNSGDIYAFWAGVADNSILWDVDKIPKGSLPLSFLVQVVDVKGTKATSRTEIVTVGTTPLDASGLCSSPSSFTGSTDTTSATDTTISPSTSPTRTSAASDTSLASNIGTTSRPSATASSGSSSPTSTADAASSSAPGTVTTAKKVSSGVIAGGVVGGVILLALLGTAFQVLSKRHSKRILDDLTEHDYHLTLGGTAPAAKAVVEKPLPAFYEHPTPGSTPLPSSAYYHDASPSHAVQNDATFGPHAMVISPRQTDLERQINVMQQEINGMQTTVHTQALQNQVNTMRGELERFRMERTGY